MSLVRRHVKPNEWQPTGIAELEPNALDVVRSTNNRSVIAGPGSGKTELLAQRASYLLQCGVSPQPQRILAISYKRDAAYNLAQRVSARCHPEQAHRFDSLTFDAFAKSSWTASAKRCLKHGVQHPTMKLRRRVIQSFASFCARLPHPRPSAGTRISWPFLSKVSRSTAWWFLPFPTSRSPTLRRAHGRVNSSGAPGFAGTNEVS